MSLKRAFPIDERLNLLLDISAFNGTDKVLFDLSSTGIDSSNYGQVSGQTNNSRDIQLAAKLNW